MLKQFLKITIASLVIALSCLALPNKPLACTFFKNADPVEWAELATSIVDATVYEIHQRPLKRLSLNDAQPIFSDPWVLKLHVHRTIRGEVVEFREVATRILNTTIVDESYVAALMEQRKEFAILDVPYLNNTETLSPMQKLGSPPQMGIRVFDEAGHEIDEI
jgi:hypothetical protein